MHQHADVWQRTGTVDYIPKVSKVEYGTKYHEVYQKYWIIANPQEYECSAWKDAWIRR